MRLLWRTGPRSRLDLSANRHYMKSVASKKKAKREVVEAEVVEAEVVEALALIQSPGLRRAPRVISFADLYATFLAAKSELTAKNYKIDLNHFADYRDAEDVRAAISDLCGCYGAEANEIVFKYKIHLKDSGYSPSTINRRLAALRSITKLARQFGVMDWRLEVDGEQLRSFKDTAGCGIDGFYKLVETIEREISDNAETDKPRAAAKRWRDRALVIIMYYAGLRRMEPLTARYPEDLRFSKQRDGMPELQIIGKKRGEREWVPIGHTAWEAIQDWLKHRGAKKGPLFPGLDPDNMLTTRTVNNMLERLSSAAGVEVTPHGLRHTAITELLERTNGDVRMTQRFARHKSAATTMLYDDNRQNLAGRGVTALEAQSEPAAAKKPAAKKPAAKKPAAKKKPS